MSHCMRQSQDLIIILIIYILFMNIADQATWFKVTEIMSLFKSKINHLSTRLVLWMMMPQFFHMTISLMAMVFSKSDK